MANRSFKSFVEQELGKVAHFLIYALLEWVLIFMLFIDGFLAFFANEFARFFELKIPCLLCTRIDHVLVRRAADFYYNDSICETHKKDVSYLAFCHNHKKLSHIRKMCDNCLLSFANDKADSHAYKSQVGILHKDDIELFLDNDHGHHFTLSAGRKDDSIQGDKGKCLCCGEPLKVKPYAKAKGSSVVQQAPTPSPRAPFVFMRNEENRSMELAHLKFTELKFPANDLDLQEDEDGKQFREDVKAATVPLLTEADDITSEEKTPTFARGNRFFGIPLTDSANASPRLGARILRKSPLEKTEFASDSMETSTAANEADGDVIFQQLKGQVKLDPKSLMSLYIELDEERSASAIAANNAMAMITRLQAEKAAVQMEALQYRRMMEEQEEYDQEALQATNDLLVKREEDMKALEDELNAYRKKYGVLEEEDCIGSGDEDEVYHETYFQSFSSLSERSEFLSPDSSTDGHIIEESLPDNNQSSSLFDDNGGGTPEKSHKGFQFSRFCDFGRFRNLNKKMNFFSDEGAPSSVCSSENVTSWPAQDIKFMRELLQLHERVKGLEADGELSKSASQTQSDSERERLLTEISDNLQKLRQFISMPSGDDA